MQTAQQQALGPALPRDLSDVQTGRVVVRVEVTDTGMGLTPEQALHLFQPFSQAHSSITHQYGGTGLGLAICQQLAELMGGQIGVESQPGQGNTFWFTARLATQTLAGIASPQPQGDLSAVRVLIVDDHATSRTLPAAAHRVLGYAIR